MREIKIYSRDLNCYGLSNILLKNHVTQFYQLQLLQNKKGHSSLNGLLRLNLKLDII